MKLPPGYGDYNLVTRTITFPTFPQRRITVAEMQSMIAPLDHAFYTAEFLRFNWLKIERAVERANKINQQHIKKYHRKVKVSKDKN